MANGIQLPAGYEDATAVAGPQQSGISLPQGYEDAQAVSGPHAAAPGTTGVSGVLNKIGETGASVASGVVKGPGDTVSGVSHLFNKIPGVGETLAPSQGICALDKMDVANGTAEAAGKGLEGIAEFVGGDELLEGLSKGTKLVALAKKYPL